MVSALVSSIPRFQRLLCVREVLQVVDIDGVLRRHDEPDLVVVEARFEGDLVRVVDAQKQRMALAVGVYRAHVDGVLRHGRHGDERGPALLHEHLQGGVHVLGRAKRARRNPVFRP